jgi:hypothetical protein
MHTVAVVIALALLVTVASGLGYNSYNRYPSIRGNSLKTWGSRGGSLFDNGEQFILFLHFILFSQVKRTRN